MKLPKPPAPAKHKQTQISTYLAEKAKSAEFVNLGDENPFNLIQTSRLGSGTKQTLTQLLINGNSTILAKFEQYRQRHAIDVQVHAVTFDYAISGDYVDVGRYMGGEPECMIDYSQQTETKFVDFYINIDVCAEVGQENSFAYYAAVISVIDSLESSNYRVKLIGVNYSDDILRGKVYEVTTTIKDYSEPVNYAYLTSICMADTPFFSAIMYRPEKNLYDFAGCDSIPGFVPNVIMKDNTFYAPSLYGTNRFGKAYASLGNKPEAFAFSELIQDWKLDHLLAK